MHADVSKSWCAVMWCASWCSVMWGWNIFSVLSNSLGICFRRGHRGALDLENGNSWQKNQQTVCIGLHFNNTITFLTSPFNYILLLLFYKDVNLVSRFKNIILDLSSGNSSRVYRQTTRTAHLKLYKNIFTSLFNYISVIRFSHLEFKMSLRLSGIGHVERWGFSNVSVNLAVFVFRVNHSGRNFGSSCERISLSSLSEVKPWLGERSSEKPINRERPSERSWRKLFQRSHT
jgi:hypothetical protein